MLKADGFDKAFLGVASRCGCEDIIAYDYDRCIGILCERDNMDIEEAIEYFHYNVLGAWVGDTTPIFIKRMRLKDLEEEIY